ncbi:MAG: hypothetical protein NTY03_01070 [Candidatus Bathyarchaeota archaeon]|nr:hypothetical protein [Candidatus Bathyarchaeota archaeon]
MPLEVYLKITDKETGKVEYYDRSHSWNIGMLVVLFISYAQASPTNQYKDTTGTLRTFITPGNNSKYWGSASAGSGVDSFGIVVGTDNTSEDAEDDNLVQKCAQGTGVGQLQYGTCVVSNAVNASGTMSFSVARQIANNSGSTITVKEVGLYLGLCTAGPTQYYICAIRDVVGDTPVTTGSTKIAEYIITMVN